MGRHESVKKGDWFLLRHGKKIASDQDLSVILKKADKYDEDEVVISKEPKSDHCYY